MNEIDEKTERLIDQQSVHGKSPDLSKHDDPKQLQFELQLQKKIDAALGRNFSTEPVSELEHRQKMETLVSNAQETQVSDSKLPERRKLLVRALVLAASVLLMVGLAWQYSDKRSSPPGVFNRQPLAKLYKKSVDRGFKPYYVCDEPERFAAEFERRQGIRLRLAEMPEHKQMSGIALLGGISRTTTAMLGLVNKEPVLVFVDYLSNDDEEMRKQVGKSDGCYVSRTTKFGLVFYEVSGFNDAQLTEYFEQAAPK